MVVVNAKQESSKISSHSKNSLKEEKAGLTSFSDLLKGLKSPKKSKKLIQNGLQSLTLENKKVECTESKEILNNIKAKIVEHEKILQKYNEEITTIKAGEELLKILEKELLDQQQFIKKILGDDRYIIEEHAHLYRLAQRKKEKKYNNIKKNKEN